VSALVVIGLLTVFFVLGYVAPQSPILGLGREDGPVEDAAALFWAAASGVCLVQLVRGQQKARLLLVFWALFSFVCLGEEVSWFQRVVGLQTPEAIAHVNLQGELNLHDLAAADFGPVLNVQYAFLLGFVAWFLILPILMGVEPLRALAEKVGYEAPDSAFWGMVASVLIVSYGLEALGADVDVRAIAESRETFYAFVVLAYVVRYLREPAAVRVEEAERARFGA
jgi:hypothetical protein